MCTLYIVELFVQKIFYLIKMPKKMWQSQVFSANCQVFFSRSYQICMLRFSMWFSFGCETATSCTFYQFHLAKKIQLILFTRHSIFQAHKIESPTEESNLFNVMQSFQFMARKKKWQICQAHQRNEVKNNRCTF